MRTDADRVERQVAAIASEVVGREDLEPNDLLELDSLGYAELVIALEDAFGVRLDDTREFASVAEAATAVASRTAVAPHQRGLLDGRGWLQPWVKIIGGPAAHRYFDVQVVGADQVPTVGPAILAANHESGWDIPLLVMASPRRIYFMGKHELFQHPAGGMFLPGLGGFEVDRSRLDFGAIRTALAVLRADRVLGMFPEGTRTFGRLGPFLAGTSWAALVTGAPIVPVGIAGTSSITPRRPHIPRRTRIRIAFGEPIDLGLEDDPRRRIARAREEADRVRAAVESLLG